MKNETGVLSSDEKDEVLDTELLQFGYVPGNYDFTISKCLDCDSDIWHVDKRCLVCRPCAVKQMVKAMNNKTDMLTSNQIDSRFEAYVAHVVHEASQWRIGSGAHPPSLKQALTELCDYYYGNKPPATETSEPRCSVCQAPLTVSVVCSDRCARRANEIKANTPKAVAHCIDAHCDRPPIAGQLACERHLEQSSLNGAEV